ARLGARVALVGRLGEDPLGKLALAKLRRYGVSTDHLTQARGEATGLAVIEIDRRGDNRITVLSGANMLVGIREERRLNALGPGAASLLLKLENRMNAVIAAARIGRRRGATVILDPAPAPAKGGLPAALLKTIDLVTPNETETEALIGLRPKNRREGGEAARRLVAMGVPAA